VGPRKAVRRRSGPRRLKCDPLEQLIVVCTSWTCSYASLGMPVPTCPSRHLMYEYYDLIVVH
jgi:hypothetical protein